MTAALSPSLRSDSVRGGDVVFYSYTRLPRGPIPEGYLEVVPELVFEVRSPSDRWAKITAKVGEYLDAGVLVACVLDPAKATDGCLSRPTNCLRFSTRKMNSPCRNSSATSAFRCGCFSNDTPLTARARQFSSASHQVFLMHCRHFQPTPVTRRTTCCSLRLAPTASSAAVALSNAPGRYAASEASPRQRRAIATRWPLKPPHYKAKAKSVIFLFMDGGPSQMDTFDPKPRLDREHGQRIKMKVEPTQFNNVGAVLKSPWKFKQYGKSGIPVSDLFPNVATCADDLAVVRSMTSNFSEHTNANYFIHSGHGQQGRPSMGAWATYGLGSECQNLPGFIVLSSGMIPPGGLDCFSNGFLPASYQGSLFQRGATCRSPTCNSGRGQSSRLQKGKLALLRKLDRAVVQRMGGDDKLESAIANYELAFRMQTAVPELMQVKNETKATRDLYGIDDPVTDIFGRQCLVARRLVQRGVRFVELLCSDLGTDRWDQHGNLRGGHEKNARARRSNPLPGCCKDLKKLAGCSTAHW